ncbi:MAG: glucosidase, partial [Planctomycetaceae bacterium]
AFDRNRYFDVQIEYAKAEPDDILIRIRITNHGPTVAPIHVLPTLWFRNTWSWGCTHEGCWTKPRISLNSDGRLDAHHQTLGHFRFAADLTADGRAPQWLFTENESHPDYLPPDTPASTYSKDAFHRCVVDGHADAVNRDGFGTKAAAHYRLMLRPGESATLKLRLPLCRSHHG